MHMRLFDCQYFIVKKRSIIHFDPGQNLEIKNEWMT